jgi:salicylate hydroxylase
MLSCNTRIAIIGGGLGGLTAAIALRQIAGVEATVFEQAKGHDEVGAGITIAPNASRIHDKLGILEKFQRAGAIPEDEGLYVDAMGNVVTDAAWEDTAREYQNIGMYRPDYLKILADEVGPEAIRVGHRLTSVETLDSGVRVHFENGVQEEFDAVIGADGFHSVVREALGQHREPVDYGYIAYRGVIDASGLPEGWPRISRTWMGHERHLMTYPLRNDYSLYNYVAAVPSDKGLEGPNSGPADSSELEADFGVDKYDWDPDVHKFISLIDETFWWSLFDVEPLTNWSRGPVALLGDSAHCMVPHQGQGVNMATEDSITLAYFLKQADSVRDIPEAFKRYTAVRMQRATILQNQSRRAGWMFNAQRQFSDTEKRDADITAGRDFRRRSVFDYDALKVAEKALKRFERN